MLKLIEIFVNILKEFQAKTDMLHVVRDRFANNQSNSYFHA